MKIEFCPRCEAGFAVWCRNPALGEDESQMWSCGSSKDSQSDFQQSDRCRVRELEQQIKELDASFQLRWKADMRAIKRWQEATGDELTWPDHADLCVWLLEQLDKK